MSDKRNDNKPKAGEDFESALNAGVIEPDELEAEGTEAPDARPGATAPSKADNAQYRDGPNGTYGQGTPQKR